MKVSVVILNWNGEQMMRKYLPGVLKNSDIPGVEVVVADNASTDNSVSMLKREFPGVPIVVLDRNYGFAEGYNKALRGNEAEYFLLLNSDVEIRDSSWLVPMIEFMDSHPDVAACQPKLLSLREPSKFEYAGACGGFLDRFGYPFCRGRVMDTIEEDKGQYDDVCDVLWASGAALMVRAADYRDSGGLDGRFFAHMEEIDLCWRLRLQGRRVVCVPQSRVYHLGGASLNQGNPRKTYLNFRNNLAMLYKNLPDKELAGIMRVRKWLDLLAAFSFLIKFDKGNFKAVLKAHKDFKKMRQELERDRQRVGETSAAMHEVHERTEFSLLWQYYVRKRKTFKKLMGK